MRVFYVTVCGLGMKGFSIIMRAQHEKVNHFISGNVYFSCSCYHLTIFSFISICIIMKFGISSQVF